MKKILFLILLLFTPGLFGQSKNYRALIKKADNFAYNFNFEASFNTLKNAISLNDTLPHAYHLTSRNYLWFYLGNKSDNDYKKFLAYSDSAIQFIEPLLEENEEDENLLYLLGNIYKYRAMAYGSFGSTLDAFWATKKSVSLFEEVLSINPKFADAKGGIGVFEYALSYVPAMFNWALSLSGLSADQSNGFDYVKVAAQKATIDKIEYQFHLAKLYDEYLANFSQAINILSPLIKHFPNNSLFHYQLAVELIKSKKLESAKSELNKVLILDNENFSQTNSFSYFLLGDIFFRLNKYDDALVNYLTFLKTSTTIDYTGIASLRAAFCYQFLNRQNEFRKYALRATNGNLDIEEDFYAKQKGLSLLENGFNKDDSLVIFTKNSYLSGNLDFAISVSVDSVKENIKKREILIYKCSALAEIKDFQNAKQLISKIDSLDISEGDWTVPWGYLLKAQISLAEKDFEKCEEFLENAEETNNYEQKKVISANINKFRKKNNYLN